MNEVHSQYFCGRKAGVEKKMEEVEVKTETENQKGKESRKEQIKSVMDYDQGFKPEYRNRVKTVNIPDTVQEIPEDEDVVAQNDEEFVQMAGEPEEQKEVEKPKQTKSEEVPLEVLQTYDFKVVMQTDIWNQVIGLLKTIVADARFTFVKEGINIRVVDPASVEMLDITMPKEELAERDAQDGTVFVLDISRMPKLKNGGLFQMSRKYTTKEREKEIQISFDGIVQTVKELDVNAVRYPRIPPISYGDESVTAEIRLEPLRKFMAVARDISDAVTFTAHREDMITVSAKSDTNKGEIVLDRDNGGILDFRMDRELTAIESNYPLEYIEKTVKATIATELEISWKTDYPMTATFRLPPVAKRNKGHYPTGVIPVTFMLAPRMEQ